jgi:hypothetical protein
VVARSTTRTAYTLAWLAQHCAGTAVGWRPPPAGPLSKLRPPTNPPALADLAARVAGASGGRRVGAGAALAFSALAYAAAWVARRPGRLAAAAFLAFILWIFI